MTPENLLRPRYKVIAPYPSMKGEGLTVGQILKCKDYDNDFSEKYWCQMNDEYPHLFKKMEWWEDREDGEIEYVKWASLNSGMTYIVKVTMFNNEAFRGIGPGGQETFACPFSPGQDMPATREEYEAQNGPI